MLKRILVVGSKGSMGRRYGAILTSLGIEWEGIDIGEKPTTDFDGVIICTPTHLHINDIEYFATDAPVLCEKPLSDNYGMVKNICRMARAQGWSLRMVNQYEYLTHPTSSGPSIYSYYNHGRDGMAWDCINIIGLSSGPVHLSEGSPVWNCVINGHPLKLSDMDSAYIKMIQSWVYGDHDNIDYILKAHEKVKNYLEAHP